MIPATIRGSFALLTSLGIPENENTRTREEARVELLGCITRNFLGIEVAPSMPRKLRVIHPSSSTRASSRVGVFSFSGIPSDVRSAKLPRIVAGIMHPPSRQRIIADRSAIQIAQSGRSPLDCGEIE